MSAQAAKAARTKAAGTVATDPVVTLLDSYKFNYDLTSIALKDVDRAESRRNQARIAEPVNEDQVLMYAEAMKGGEVFPPIVVHKSGSTYIVMDGNHRVAAADLADITTLPAYVVKGPSPAQVTSFTYAANTKHGMPTSLQDRIRQAISLISEKGVTAVAAAKDLGIPLHRLRTELENFEANVRFRELGVKRFDTLPLGVRRRLHTIHSNRVLSAAAELALEAGMTADEASKFVKRINLKRSEREAIEVVKAEREARQALISSTAGNRIPVPQALVTLARFSSGIANIEERALKSAGDSVTNEARSEYARLAKESGARLIQLAAVLDSGQ